VVLLFEVLLGSLDHVVERAVARRSQQHAISASEALLGAIGVMLRRYGGCLEESALADLAPAAAAAERAGVLPPATAATLLDADGVPPSGDKGVVRVPAAMDALQQGGGDEDQAEQGGVYVGSEGASDFGVSRVRLGETASTARMFGLVRDPSIRCCMCLRA
jgi:hypothetical protein